MYLKVGVQASWQLRLQLAIGNGLRDSATDVSLVMGPIYSSKCKTLERWSQHMQTLKSDQWHLDFRAGSWRSAAKSGAQCWGSPKHKTLLANAAGQPLVTVLGFCFARLMSRTIIMIRIFQQIHSNFCRIWFLSDIGDVVFPCFPTTWGGSRLGINVLLWSLWFLTIQAKRTHTRVFGHVPIRLVSNHPTRGSTSQEYWK